MTDKTQIEELDPDQELILAVYSFYSHESNHSYLQYTAACALFYYLTQKEFFDYNLNEMLVYDYKESRRYIWEAKKFMSDINILRDKNLLIRARTRSKTYRDINAHQCSVLGHEYVGEKIKESEEFREIVRKARKILSTKEGELYDVKLGDNGPVLVNERGGENYISYSPIQGFLKDLDFEHVKTGEKKDKPDESYKPFFI